MRLDLLDVALVAVALLFAVSGYRRGFLVGALSLVGFLAGAVAGALLAPQVAAWEPLTSLPAAAVGLLLVLVLAVLGQLVCSSLGAVLRRRLTSLPARRVDGVAGAGVSVVSLLLIAWLVALAVAESPFPGAAGQVRRSTVIGAVDAAVPEHGRRLFSSFRELIDSRGFPTVFDDLRPVDPDDMPAPDAAVATGPLVQRMRGSVLKVTGQAPSCRRSSEGSGFVYAPERVLTNAHVLAGVERASVQVDGHRMLGTVVLYDPARDLAVLRVPGLTRPALAFSAVPAAPSDDAVILGYPLDGPFRSHAARVLEKLRARGADIYGDEPVTREIYTVRGLVRSGNSGGPLVNDDGQVQGVVFAAAADDSSVGYVLTAESVQPVADSVRTATTSVPTGPCT